MWRWRKFAMLVLSSDDIEAVECEVDVPSE